MLSPTAWKILESFWPSAPEPSGTSSAICTKTLWTSSNFGPGTLRNLVRYLRRSTPEPAGTSSAICPGTLRNPHQLLRYLPWNHNLISHLHRNPPEPHRPSAPEPSGTLRNLLRNLVLQLHRIAPELFWAKDPIASFAVGGKIFVINFQRKPLITHTNSLTTVASWQPPMDDVLRFYPRFF